MSINKFSPNSHFFVDHTNISTPDIANLAVDGFGPVQGNLSSKYRTTSFVRSSAVSKVFAICDGYILIQNNTEDNSKVNIILRPTVSYSPFKIKYFIYRGVNKADIINGANLASSTSNSPDFLKRIWALNFAISTAINVPPATQIEAKSIGYDASMPDTTLLDEFFFKSDSEISLPKCTKGELLGNFSGFIGLDIVIDRGDYHLDYEQETFNFNLGFARKYNHVLDLSPISGAAAKKKYKEYIHQFIDAAAFWGAHINNGNLRFHSMTAPVSSGGDIYNNAVKHYQTRHKLYFYLVGERGRSYNYYGTSLYPTGKVSVTLSGQPENQVSYEQDGWPILIKEFDQPLATTVNRFQFSFEYNLDTQVYSTDINFFAYLNFPRYDAECFKDVNELGNGYPVGQCKPIVSLFSNIGLPATSPTKNYPVSSFHFGYIKASQRLPSQKYHEDLWTFNTKDIFETPGSGINKVHLLNRYNTANLSDLLKFRNAVTQQKVFSDYGKNLTGGVKKRKLYIASITDTYGSENSELNNSAFNVSKTSETIKSNEELSSFLFNDRNYAIYKGKINDSGNDISTLSLIHKENHRLTQKFFLFGITEEEYNKILYNNLTPITGSSTSHLPSDVSNISIHLNEVSSPANKSYKKYSVGLKFENSAGNLEIKYPTGSNIVEVFTVDGLFFCSKEFASYQEFFSEISSNEVHFRPKTDWQGEFGFDWIRIQDSGLPGDSGNRKYLQTVGHYYLNATTDEKDDNDTNFRAEKEEFHSLTQNFFSYPRQLGLESTYSSPWLAIYPSKNHLGVATPFPKLNEEGKDKCLTTVRLNLILNFSSPSAISLLKLKFEKKHFEIRSINTSLTSILPDTTDESGNIFTNLKINNTSSGAFPNSIEIEVKAKNEFAEVKTIRCISTEGGGEKFSGELKVIPNSKDNRYETSILLINCTTDLDPSSTVTGLETVAPFVTRNKILSEINKTLNQSLIDIKAFRTVSLDLTRASRPVFYTSYGAIAGTAYLRPRVQHSYIKGLLSSSDQISNEIKIFCIDELCGEPAPVSGTIVTSGEVSKINVPDIILYKSGLYKAVPASDNDVNTSGHESMHGLGLYHSFSDDSMYTMKKFITDNIMDYKNSTSLTTGYRTTSMKYQWNVMKRNPVILKEV
ncbi:hypothetical protein [Chryseobacterium sp. JUb7]|uniref:hypothetical protein n=1 Tax=Chryseobacterium sp. JUb7 TaxID=2940599 RepID=UPI00216765F9|nr:hypothetical protein [Chryseobacterium sp. JUb7]MCS3533046.1 hypothetical protein [Chryseobacterium sp. JUb7]